MTLSFLLTQAGTASAAETALIVTLLITGMIVALVLFVLIVPESDQKNLGKALARWRRLLIVGSKETGTQFDHEFDGIREFDNRIPPWFTYLFVATIVFAVLYMLDYHVFGTSKLMHAEYEEEVAAADLQRRVLLATEGTIDENTLVALSDPAGLTKGGEHFQKWCVSCHGNQAQGVVGPNLTDQYWIHGGDIRSIYRTIKLGVPAKGMISWQLVLTPKQIQEVSSYVLSLQGTNPPGAKKPEGTVFATGDSTAAPL